MADTNYLQTNFTGGRLSPRLLGRTDLSKYYNGAEEIENFVVQQHGGAIRRSGTKFVKPARSHTDSLKLIPFQFSTTQAYMLEFGETYVRFYKDRAQITDSRTLITPFASWSGGTATLTVAEDTALSTPFASWADGTATLTVASHNVVAGDAIKVSVTNAPGYDGTFMVTSVTSNTILYAIDTNPGGTPSAGTVTENVNTTVVGDTVTASVTGAASYDGTYTITAVTDTTISYALASDPGGSPSAGTATVPYQVASPYTAAQLTNLNYSQSADILFLTHPDVRPKELQRTGDTDWTFVNYEYIDGPYLPQNTDESIEMQVDIASPGTGRTITATSAVFTTGSPSPDIGRKLRLAVAGDSWGYMTITAVASTTSATVTLHTTLVTAMTDSFQWHLGAWSDGVGWPWVSAFSQNRIWFGATDTEPSTVWGSETGKFNSFAPNQASPSSGTTGGTNDGVVLDTHGITSTLDDDKVNAIYWLASNAKGLAIGTDGGEFVMPRTPDSVLTPSNSGAAPQTNRGSKRAVRRQQASSGTVIFVQKTGRKVYEMEYTFDNDRFNSQDLTKLSEDITVGSVTDTAYQREPYTIFWALRNDGTLLGLTYERTEEVVAWHTHEIGGAFSGGIAQVQAIAVIYDDSVTQPTDQLWMVVKRTIDGNTKQYIEYMNDFFDTNTAQADGFFVDCGTTTTGTDFTTVSGLDHLEGETVAVNTDGSAQPNATVSGGSITLAVKADKAHVGFPFTSTIKTQPIVLSQGQPTTRHKIRRVERAHVMFHNTVGAKIGPDTNNLEVINFRSGNDAMNTAPPLFTGTKIDILLPFRHEREQNLFIIQDQPLPMTVLSATLDLEAHVDS